MKEEEIDPTLQPENQMETIEEEEKILTPDPQPSGDDPLDKLSDPEELRQEAKKFRAISSRVSAKPKEEPKPAATVPQAKESPYLTRDDFYKSNEKKAIRLATTVEADDPEKELKEEVNANWDEVKNFYTPRRGRETPEDILEDIFDAHAVWKRHGGKSTKTANPAADLATITVAAPSGGTPKPSTAQKAEDDPRFRPHARPDNWYK